MEQHLILVFVLAVRLSPGITQQAVNVAPRGRAAQSAEPLSPETGPSMAIDSYNNPSDTGKTCASVPIQDDPWWRLDLGSIYRVTSVSISTAECCQEQMNGAEVRIGFREDVGNHRCAIMSTTVGRYRYDYQCEAILGRFIHVVLPGRQQNLTVCEVQVFGTVLENVALKGVAYQSSLREKATGKASSVIDGFQLSTCTMTQNKPAQWIKVDLLAAHNVTVIQLAFREDCCYEVKVHVDDTRCSGVSTSSESLMTLDCGGIVGNTVTVFLPDIPLTLCEVEIFSTWEHPENTFPQRPLPSDYCAVEFCSRDYILIDKEPMTWPQAKAYCRERHTDLATADIAQDMNRIVDKMSESELQSFWIGLYEDKLTWRWSQLRNVNEEFRNWASDEPSNKWGIPKCVGVQDSGEWLGLDCSLLNYFLCFDGRDSASEANILVQTPMKWTDAQQYCREKHTDLVTVRNSAQNEEIRGLVPAGRMVWIGLSGDNWKWSDGSGNMFRYWQQGQPGISVNQSNCAQVDGGMWKAKSCDTKAAFLCYYYKKKFILKISTNFNVCDPHIQQQIQKQLEGKMESNGIRSFKVRWKSVRKGINGTVCASS